jgi:hypothetical protein
MRVRRLRKRIAPPAAKPEVAVLLTAPRNRPSPKLPHERDESPSPPQAPDPTIAQGERDLAQGREDTDRYQDAQRVFEHRTRRR